MLVTAGSVAAAIGMLATVCAVVPVPIGVLVTAGSVAATIGMLATVCAVVLGG